MKHEPSLKTWGDLQHRFRVELTHWIGQQDAAFTPYYLYYVPTSPERDGDILVTRNVPPNPNYQLASPQAIRRDCTVNQNMRVFEPILRTLPVLSI